MWRVFLREIFVLLIALALFPTAVILLLLHNDSVHTGLVFLYRQLISGGSSPEARWICGSSCFPLSHDSGDSRLNVVPQEHHGQKMGEPVLRLASGRCQRLVLLEGLGPLLLHVRVGRHSAELKQFVQLEGDSLLGCFLTLVLGIYCFSIFLNPSKGTKRNQFDSGYEES